jgi:prefoldin alpha subunit
MAGPQRPDRPNPPHGQPGHVHGDEGDGDGLAEDPRQLAAQMDLVQRELQRVDRHLAALEEALVEAQQAVGAVRHLADDATAQDILLPLGAGVHLHAKVDGAAPVLMPLGAGYFTEGPAASVAEALQERAQALTAQFQQASEDAQRLAQVAAAINDRLSQFQET